MLKIILLFAILLIGTIFGQESDEFHVHIPRKPSRHYKRPRGKKHREYQDPPLGLRTHDSASDNIKVSIVVVRRPLYDNYVYEASPYDVNLALHQRQRKDLIRTRNKWSYGVN